MIPKLGLTSYYPSSTGLDAQFYNIIEGRTVVDKAVNTIFDVMFVFFDFVYTMIACRGLVIGLTISFRSTFVIISCL